MAGGLEAPWVGMRLPRGDLRGWAPELTRLGVAASWLLEAPASWASRDVPGPLSGVQEAPGWLGEDQGPDFQIDAKSS